MGESLIWQTAIYLANKFSLYMKPGTQPFCSFPAFHSVPFWISPVPLAVFVYIYKYSLWKVGALQVLANICDIRLYLEWSKKLRMFVSG